VDGVAVGACAFKSAPTQKREVEIAYLTFPEHERRGFGAAMAQSLFEIAAGSGEIDRVIAQTLREENASARICRRLHFNFEGDNLDPEDGLVWRWSKQTQPNQQE
jgi:RimJ/RimL family protein N-acetyltransferase